MAVTARMKFQPSEIALVTVNLIPVAGLVFFGWSVFDVFFLYWLESAILGFFGILKMIVIGMHLGGVWKSSLFFSVPFFLVHYGGFMLGHLIFIIILFNGQGENLSLSYSAAASIVQQTFTRVSIAFLSMFVSHAFSFVNNFLKQREYFNSDPQRFKSLPYGRIAVMHLSVFLALFVTIFLKIPVLAPALIICTKVVTDLRAHRREHRGIVLSGM